MGRGIERRARQLPGYWSEHLDRTSRAVESWVHGLHGDATLLVLGAGRLLDLDLRILSARSPRLVLVDADREAVRTVRSSGRLPPGARYVEREVSGVIDSWSKALKAALAGTCSLGDAIGVIERIPREHEPAPVDLRELAGGDYTAVSINLLSQIPILWQDLVESALLRRFGRRALRAAEDSWLHAIVPAARRLIVQHLDALGRSSETSLLLTDIEYAHYSGVTPFDRARTEELPFTCRDGEWYPTGRALGSAVRCEVMPALFGVSLETWASERGTPLVKLDEWLWHLQPLGYEDRRRGVIHRVAAFVIGRSCETGG